MGKKSKIDVGYQFDQATQQLKNLHGNSQKVVRFTVSDFKKSGLGWVGKAVKEEYNISPTRIRQDFKGAKGGSATKVGLKFSGHLLTVGRFKMKPKKRKAKNKPYDMTIEVVRGQQKKLPQDTFVAALGEQPQAFRREGKKRYPIQMVKTLSIPQMISSKRGAPKVEALVTENVQKRKDHHEKRFFK